MESIVRAFELPVGAIEPIDGRDGWALVRQCWHEATCLANWGTRQLLANDVVRLSDMDKLPPPPRVNGPVHKGLYGLANDTIGLKTGFWAGACISAATILRDVERAYNRDRLAVIWQRRQAPRTYRYPYPWPVHASGWKKAGFANDRPFVICALPGGHVRFRLRGGPEFGRQMALFREVATGHRPRLQLVIREQPCSSSCHRPRLRDHPGDSRLLIKMVAHLSVPPRREGRVLALCADPAAFWVAELDGRPAWVLNNDHYRRLSSWLAVHEARRQRLAQDAKAERRLGNRERAWQRSLERACDKQHRRLSSWLHETTAHLAGFAARNGVSRVLYRDMERGFMPLFPWHRLKKMLVDRLQAEGITCTCLSDGPIPDEQLPQEGDKTCPKSTATAARRLFQARRRSGSHSAVCEPSATAPTSPSGSPSTP